MLTILFNLFDALLVFKGKVRKAQIGMEKRNVELNTERVFPCTDWISMGRCRQDSLHACQLSKLSKL